MIKKVVFLLVCAYGFVALAQVSVGGNVQTHWYIQNREQGANPREQRDTEFELQLIPSVIITPAASRWEIVPFAGFTVVTHEHEIENANGELVEDWDGTDFGFGAGCGLYYRAIEGDVLRLSLGPQLSFWNLNRDGDDNYRLNLGAALPINVDFLLTDKLFLRAAMNLLEIKYEYDETSETNHSGRFTFFDIRTMWQPSVGFYVTF